MFTHLILFKPGEIGFITLGKLLRALNHKVDEVSASSEAGYDQKICQNPEKPSKVDVLIFLVLLFIYNGFLNWGKIIQRINKNRQKSTFSGNNTWFSFFIYHVYDPSMIFKNYIIFNIIFL